MYSLISLAALSLLAGPLVQGKEDKQWVLQDEQAYAQIERDVVIIGGGASGTYAATRLRQMNKSVAVVERNDRLGGHVNTYRIPGTDYACDYGVVVFGDTPVVHDFFDHFGVPLGSIPSNAPVGETAFADFETGTPINISASGKLPTSPDPQEAYAAFLTYGSVISKYPYLYEGKGFGGIPDPVPEELLMTWGESIEEYNLSAIAYPTWEYNQGVGNILDLPMLYQFKYFNQELLRISLAGLFQINLLFDNQLLYDRALAELRPDVFLGSTATSIDRSEESVKVRVSGPDGRTIIKASKLIIAIPPLLEDLAPFLDLNAEESGLFGLFFNDYYWNGLVANSGIPDNVTIDNIAPNSPHGVPQKPGLYASEATGVPGLQRVHFSTSTWMSDEAVQEEILCTLARLVKAFGYAAGDGEPVFVAFESHNPFELQVPTDAIRDGFYTKLEALQGKRNTWYVRCEGQDHGRCAYSEPRVEQSPTGYADLCLHKSRQGGGSSGGFAIASGTKKC